jgi:hypothetical protein
MIWMLQHGQVEVREAQSAVTIDGRTYPAGSYVVPMQQPFGGYAKALLERQKYPNLFEYPGGPPKRPYDVTAHTLPLLLGVDVAATQPGSAPVAGPPIAALPYPAFTAPSLSGASSKRIAIYQSYPGSMDEGWTRYVFDAYKIPYVSIHDRDVRAGNLNARFDVVILPSQSAGSMIRGVSAAYPDSLEGGLGDKGAEVFSAFVEQGGTLIAFNDATDYAIEALKLPVRDVLGGVRQNDFYAPGSILGVEIDKSHPVSRAFNATVPAIWFENGPAFEVTNPSQAAVVARYPAAGSPLLSGWLLGGERINGKAALVDVTKGRGHAILFGFRPQYRGQSEATYPLIWGAILR